MGLDLTVSEQTDFRKDSKGRMQYTVTELYNFNHNGYKIVEYVSDLSDMSNCSTVTVDAKDFVAGLQQMKDDMSFIEHDGEHYANEESELKRAIEDLEYFIEENNLNDSELDWGDRTFEVHMWY
jgi:hypothetical protein